MAQYTLKNEQLTIVIDEFGAELHSIYHNKNQQEYLWNGDSTYWGRRSPVLFPIVGSLRNKEYTYENQTYHMGQHGFARDHAFTCLEQSENQLTFGLESSSDTLEVYPFQFLLKITYTLKADTVAVTWEVTNHDTKTMYFSIGGHPAFLCPIAPNTKQTDYFLQFDSDKLTVTTINGQGLAMKDKQNLDLTHGILPITEHLFDNDALIVEGNQAHTVSLLKPENMPYLTVKFDAPLFGIWSPAKKQAPFVCIEPWYGRCDAKDFDGELKDREWGNQLEPNSTFHASYTIQIQ